MIYNIPSSHVARQWWGGVGPSGSSRYLIDCGGRWLDRVTGFANVISTIQAMMKTIAVTSICTLGIVVTLTVYFWDCSMIKVPSTLSSSNTWSLEISIFSPSSFSSAKQGQLFLP